ncbi:MAG: hypothetical protein HY460_01975 [Parcubacteria group bacterium]|nr:hypothetical protein [Parcubacteria group bacterium]
MPQQSVPLKNFNPRQVKALALVMELELGYPEFVYYRRPDSAPDPLALFTKIPDEEIPFLLPDAFAGQLGIAFATALGENHLQAIGAHASIYTKESIRIALEDALASGINADVARRHLAYIGSSPAWQ